MGEGCGVTRNSLLERPSRAKVERLWRLPGLGLAADRFPSAWTGWRARDASGGARFDRTPSWLSAAAIAWCSSRRAGVAAQPPFSRRKVTVPLTPPSTTWIDQPGCSPRGITARSRTSERVGAPPSDRPGGPGSSGSGPRRPSGTGRVRSPPRRGAATAPFAYRRYRRNAPSPRALPRPRYPRLRMPAVCELAPGAARPLRSHR